MRVSDGQLLVSPSDVVEATACTHRTLTAFRVAHGVQAPPDAPSSNAVARAGDEHEARVTERFAATEYRLIDLSSKTRDVDAWRRLKDSTLAQLLQSSADVVLQAGIFHVGSVGLTLVGRPDYLVRTPSGWRVEDAKLARSVKPTALLQTMLYRDALIAAGVPVHDDVRLHLGNGDVRDVPARAAAAWARRQFADFARLVADLPHRGALDPDYTALVTWCSECDDDSPCGQQRKAQDHLGGVADMRRDQARRLTAAGIDTIQALATSVGPVPGLAPATLASLREQAALQVQARETGQVPVQLRAHPSTIKATDVRPGLWLVPDPDAGDVFFDMEGDPLYTTGAPGAGAGLEYLFGATHDGDRFTAFWAHDREAERQAFIDFVDWVEARRDRYPGLHVYHYAAYEKTALKRLAFQHAARGEVIDDWLVNGVMVDLYNAVRGGLRAGVPSYSIKKIERLYGAQHTGDVATAMESIEQYEAYRLTGDHKLLERIEAYNRDDCDSTRDLRDYLLELRSTAVKDRELQPLQIAGGDAEEVGATAPSVVSGLREQLSAKADELLGGADPSAVDLDSVAESRRVLAGLLGYQVREEKAAWQDVFRVAEDVAARGATAAVEDSTVLGGLVLDSADIRPGSKGPKIAWTFSAPAQDHKVKAEAALACIHGVPVNVMVDDVGAAAGGGLSVTVSMLADRAAEGQWSLEVPPPIDALLSARVVRAEAQQRSLLDLAESVGSSEVTSPGAPRAAGRALLLGRASLSVEHLPEALPDEAPVEHAVRLVRGASGLTLAVQGPPGSGKSYLGATVVDAMLDDAHRDGRPVRIGVTANSHEVIHNLLRSIHERTPAASVRHFDSKRSKAKDSSKWTPLCDHGPCGAPALATGRKDGWAAGEVLGGTAWAFSPEDSPELDLLIVDEAGQMSLGDVLAASRNARNLLLLGDPQQLAKPAQAAHPHGVGVSALEHLMGGVATMPPERGIFLDSTWRMHSDVADFISDIAYDGKLTADPSCAARRVLPLHDDDALAGTGLRFVPVAHQGNPQSSQEEAEAVARLVAELLRRRWSRDGEVVDLDPSEILVVSPYTVQVRRVEAALEARGLNAVRVGTVDKFQGKEAAAVIYSTASSDAEAAPRGLGFLYDLHRLNVAVSRAKCLAFWVGSRELLRPRVTAVGQVPLVNALCRFAEDAVLVDLRIPTPSQEPA